VPSGNSHAHFSPREESGTGWSVNIVTPVRRSDGVRGRERDSQAVTKTHFSGRTDEGYGAILQTRPYMRLNL